MLRDLLFVTADAACVCAAFLFLVAAWSKLRERAMLAAVIANYRLLPRAAVAPVAALLPWAELAIGAALLLGERRVAPAAGGALLVVFAAGMAINIKRGRAFIDCGCGLGGLRQSLRPAFVWRNLALAIVMAPALATHDANGLYYQVTAFCAGGATFLLLLLLNALLALPALERHAH